MDRRRFLGVAGATTVSFLSGCGGGGGSGDPANAPDPSDGETPSTGGQAGPGTQQPDTGSPPPASTTPTQADWQALGSALAGTLILPTSSSYDQAREAFNARYDGNRPQAVVRCATPDDVSEVLSFVRRFKLPVVPRCGGHSYGGYSTTTGIVIDVGPMNAIQVNGNTATIGAGAKLVDVYDQLTAQGVCIPSGSCLSVGIAGITQGGGISVVDRMYGLTCDQLLSAEVVTADGSRIQCDAANHADLFWALRGGGGGNFGVVTAFTFRTFQTGNLTHFTASYPMANAAGVMAAWMAWASGLPDRIWTTAVFSVNVDEPNTILFSISGMCIGDQADLDPYWDRFLDSAGAVPDDRAVYTLPHRQMMLNPCYDKTVSECHLPGQTPDARLERNAMAGSSDIFDAVIPAAGIQAMLQAIQARLASGRTGVVKIDSLGGAIARIAPDATAFVHRNALFDAQYYAYFPVNAASATVDEAGQWATGMRSVMRPWSTGRAYQNYIDPRIQDWPNAYYGSNYARLVRVKAQYDPERVFNFAQGIPPA